MRRRIFGAAALTVCVILAASDCAISTDLDVAGTAPGSSGTTAFCDWFPQSQLASNPHPAPIPYGNPAAIASFESLAKDIQSTFDTSQRMAQYCASGQTDVNGPIDPAACNELYWGFQYADTPYAVQEMCNFMYLRADNAMWTTLTPKVLNQYGDYLGIQTDGQNTPNLAAGPHVTIASGGAVNAQFGSPTAPFGTMSVTNGHFDAASLATAAAPAFTATSGVTWDGGTSQLPLLAGQSMSVNCKNVYVAGSNIPVALSSLPTTTTKFWCTAQSNSTLSNPTVGTPYIQIQVANVTATSATFYAAIPVLGPTNTILRKSGTSYDPANIVLPIGTNEVAGNKTTKLTLPETCSNGSKVGADQCLHIWVTKVNPGQSCVVWLVLEVDKSDITQTMTKYGLSTAGFTAHISLGNNNQKNNWAACQNAQALNAAMGAGPSGNPPPAFVAQTNNAAAPS